MNTTRLERLAEKHEAAAAAIREGIKHLLQAAHLAPSANGDAPKKRRRRRRHVAPDVAVATPGERLIVTARRARVAANKKASVGGAMRRVLLSASGPLSADDIWTRVEALGYHSKSRNPRALVNINLGDWLAEEKVAKYGDRREATWELTAHGREILVG